MRLRIAPYRSLLLIALLSAAACLGLLVGCSHDSPVAPGQPSVETTPPPVDQMRDLEQLASQPDGGISRLSGPAAVVKLPAGSVDGLAAAIAAAGAQGVVIVRSGMHTESGRVTITQPVSILGENGAVLKIGSEPDPNIVLVAPALYVLRADDVTIWGLEIRPLGPFGNTAIFVQDSARALIGRNSLFDHQTVIGLQHANQARIWGNTINSGGGDGIVCMNGKQVFVRGNDVTNSSFGLWACDENGQASNNNLHGNFIGLILCKVPLASILPDGQMVGSELSAARWIVADNRATGNADAGYLAIDGANHNLVFNNAASNNGTYDIDLAGDTFRFGFLTPLSHDNTVIAGIYRTVRIKDCGVNNQVFGGVHVDTGTDPCY